MYSVHMLVCVQLPLFECCSLSCHFSLLIHIVHCSLYFLCSINTSPFLNVSCIVRTLCLTHCMYPHVPHVSSVRPPLLLCPSPHPSLPPAGSMVPFTLRLLHAQVPSYVNNHQLTVTRLCRLQFICGQVRTLAHLLLDLNSLTLICIAHWFGCYCSCSPWWRQATCRGFLTSSLPSTKMVGIPRANLCGFERCLAAFIYSGKDNME